MCCSIIILSYWPLIIIFQPPINDVLVDSDDDGDVPTIGDITATKKMPWDESKSNGSFSIAYILEKIKNDNHIYGSLTKRIISQDYNNSRYETTKISLAFRFVQSLRLNPTLKPLTNLVDDPEEPTNKIEQFYVQCRGAATTARLKVANASLTHFSTTLVKDGHCLDETTTPLQFAQAQYQPNNVSRMLRTLFSHFRKKGLTFSLSKDFNGKGMLIVFI